jgi:hypothetical protein
MLRIFTRVQLLYAGLAVAACLGLFYYQANYVWPVQRCESGGGWWSDKYRECATPMPIWRFTGRMPGQPRPPPGQTPPTAFIVPGAVPVTAPAAPPAKP